MTRGGRVLLTVFLMYVFGSVRADSLSDRDLGPLAVVFGLPDSQEGASLLARGDSRWGATLLVASHSVADAGANELLILDGETTRLALHYRRGFGERLELGVEIPFITHQAGGLDSVIDEWHRVFGLPDGARDGRPRDVLQYAYRDGSDVLIDFDQSESGVGDVRFIAGYTLKRESAHRVALRLGAKLPTGDSDTLLGSGGMDLSAGIAVEHDALCGAERWSGFYAAHVAFLGEPEFLAERHKAWVWQASGGLHYRLSSGVTLTAQGLLRSAAYDAAVASLGEPALMLTFGGEFRLSDRWALSIGVAEDLKVESVPDVTFQLGLRMR